MNFKFIPPVKCIKCSKILESMYDDTYGMVNGGIVERINAPFGSKHDGTTYQFGICDDCIDTTPELTPVGDYMTGMGVECLAELQKESDRRVESLRPVFNNLKNEWLKDTRFDSYIYPLKPSALKIIAMGINDALPYIMEEMQKDPLEAPWFIFMYELFRDKGIAFPTEEIKEYQGNTRELNRVWLDWLVENGFLERV